MDINPKLGKQVEENRAAHERAGRQSAPSIEFLAIYGFSFARFIEFIAEPHKEGKEQNNGRYELQRADNIGSNRGKGSANARTKKA